jgi:hypothetical protein
MPVSGSGENVVPRDAPSEGLFAFDGAKSPLKPLFDYPRPPLFEKMHKTQIAVLEQFRNSAQVI